MLALHMALGIAGAAYAKIPLLFDVPDQIYRIGIGAGDKVLGPVAAQSKDVFNPSLLHFRQALGNFLPGRITAGQVGQGRDVVAFLDIGGHFHGFFRSAAACTVSHADKIHTQSLDSIHGFENAAKSSILFGREYFAGKGDFFGVVLQKGLYFHWESRPFIRVFFIVPWGRRIEKRIAQNLFAYPCIVFLGG